MQGKLFQKCTHLLGGNVNTRRMLKPDMGIHLSHKKNQWNILVIGNYYLQIPPRENWFLYVRRVYTTAINFPCITPLIRPCRLPGAFCTVTHKAWDFQDDCTEFIWSVSLYVWFPSTVNLSLCLIHYFLDRKLDLTLESFQVVFAVSSFRILYYRRRTITMKTILDKIF